jgi:hypothetical protein
MCTGYEAPHYAILGVFFVNTAWLTLMVPMEKASRWGLGVGLRTHNHMNILFDFAIG